jgi:hypothetical protein
MEQAAGRSSLRAICGDPHRLARALNALTREQPLSLGAAQHLDEWRFAVLPGFRRLSQPGHYRHHVLHALVAVLPTVILERVSVCFGGGARSECVGVKLEDLSLKRGVPLLERRQQLALLGAVVPATEPSCPGYPVNSHGDRALLVNMLPPIFRHRPVGKVSNHQRPPVWGGRVAEHVVAEQDRGVWTRSIYMAARRHRRRCRWQGASGSRAVGDVSSGVG